jgi:serine protease Do
MQEASMKSNVIVRSLIAVAAGALIVGGCAKAETAYLRNASVSPAAASAAGAQASKSVVLPDFSSIVEKYGPAVVNISVTESANAGANTPPFSNVDPNDPFYQFFRHFGVPMQPHGVPMTGLGSGFIVRSDGLILTNAHVVDKAKEVTVKLTTGREYRAKILGADDHSDVALLKIDAHDLPTVKLGKSSDVRVGQWVVAIGSPYGFDNTVTSGIISAKGRSLGSDTYVPYLQTNAVVNPGSSGGPLFDLNGEVIGINSQIYSRSGGYQGLSFAIPIEVAVNVEDQLLQTGHVTHGRIGVTIQNVNQGLADSFGLKAPEGALVSSVDPDGPAAKAGIVPGDVILQFNGKAINQSTTLPGIVAQLQPGSTATMQVWRDGSTRDVSVTIGKLGNNVVAEAGSPQSAHGKLGLAVRPLTPAERKESGVSGGLVVDDASGPAANAGIQPGDVILRVNGTAVSSPAQLEALVAKAGKHVALLVERNDTTLFVPIDLG